MNRRIIIIDDQEEILRDYQEILSPFRFEDPELEKLETELFKKQTLPSKSTQLSYEVFLVRDGKHGFELVKGMREKGEPIAVAFIDMRMPGWDGLETAKRIREIDSEIEIVIVTAYSDQNRMVIVERVGEPSKLLYLKKPFDVEEIRQLALALTEKWNLAQKDKKQKELLKELLVRISQVKHLGLKNLQELLEVVLGQMVNLLEAESGFLCQVIKGKIEFRVGSGRFQKPESIEVKELLPLHQEIILRDKDLRSSVRINSFKLIPFYVVEYETLVLVVEDPREELLDEELLQIFVENVSSAIDAGYLYELLYQSHRELEEANRELKIYKDDLERKIVERTQELYRLNELHRNIIDNAGLAIFTFDPAGKIKSANHSSKQIFGYELNELLGKHLQELFAPEAEWLDRIKKLADRDFPWEEEALMRKKAEEVFPVHLSVSKIKLNGEGDLFIVLVSDLTERKQLEQELLQSQKLESIGILAGGVAHNFNNLLFVILNSLSEIQDQLGQNPELAFNLELIKRSAHQASELTQQLLNFSRRKPLKRDLIKLKDLIQELVSLLGKTIHKNIRIETELEADLPLIEGDPALLQQALLNLGLNARDAMRHGGVIRFEAGRYELKEKKGELGTGEFIKLVVEDTGIGIQPEIINHIFEPFFTTKGLEQGTGLGLATTYGIIKNHQGSIEVESKLGEGSRFTILLPVAREGSKEEDSIPLVKEIKGQGKILIIDDEEGLRKLAELKLKKLGYEVLSAGSGEEAISLVKEHLDLKAIAMDMIMPGISGKELFRRIKSINQDVAVLLISGYSPEGDAEELLEMGAMGYLQKPFMIEEMVEVIEAGAGIKGSK